jgi:hypothetical protein
LQGKIYLAFMLLFLPSTTECKGPSASGFAPSEGYVTVSPSSKDEVCFCKENKTKTLFMNEPEFLQLIGKAENWEIEKEKLVQTRDYRGYKLQEYLKKQPPLSKIQKEILIGSLLGDGCLRKTSVSGLANAYFKYDQMFSHSSLVYLVYLVFQNITGTPPSIRYKDFEADSKTLKKHSCSFRTYRLPVLTHYYNQFYQLDSLGNLRKRVPIQIKDWLTPIGLAFWFMEDGSTESSGLYFHTQGFQLNDVELLRQVLNEKFGLQTSLITEKRAEKKYYKIYVKAESRPILTELIKPYIIECFKYKLGFVVPSLAPTPSK